MGEEEERESASTASAALQDYSDDIDSCCSTPYVSAPSSPGRSAPFTGFYYSAPASPTHFILSTTALTSYPPAAASNINSSFEFDFSSTFPNSGASSPASMTSAEELFFNGQIRPMKLSTHLQRPQLLEPLVESDDVVEEDHQAFSRGREMKLRDRSLRRRTRSMSPNRTTNTTPFIWQDDIISEKQNDDLSRDNGEGAAESGVSNGNVAPSASRSSSGGRSSRRWVFLKEFLYRSKSEGRNEGHKFWVSLSFSPAKDRKMPPLSISKVKDEKNAVRNDDSKKRPATKPVAVKRSVPPPSPHEVHYTAKRAQAEEMRKRTFLPYRQGVLGCLGFSSRSYGAMNGFAGALNRRVFKVKS